MATISSETGRLPNRPASTASIRRELRESTVVPIRMSTDSSEFPAVLIDVSASGLRALVDTRFADFWPLPAGAEVDVEFYVDNIEVQRATLILVRLTALSRHRYELGFEFLKLDDELRLAIRARASKARAVKSRRH